MQLKNKLSANKLVIATHNQGKVAEISDLLSPYDVKCLSAAELGLSEPEETGESFEENAIIKARSACEESSMPALADDSGLSVNALGGDPGIYSARWAGKEKDFGLAMRKVHEGLESFEDKSAAFICCLALCLPEQEPQIFEGRVEGQIIWPARGDKGFGYDPIFVPDGFEQSFAEMDFEQKQTLSHRGRALKSMINTCFK